MNIFVAFFLLLLLLTDNTPPAAAAIPLIGNSSIVQTPTLAPPLAHEMLLTSLTESALITISCTENVFQLVDEGVKLCIKLV